MVNNQSDGGSVDVNLTVSLNRSGIVESVMLIATCIFRRVPNLVLKAWKSENYYLYYTNVPYYSAYSSEIPELENYSISINDARYLGSSYVYILVETNSNGVVSISGDGSSYVNFSSQDNGTFLITVNNSTGGQGSSVTKDLVISVGETETYDELNVTLSITFVNGSGTMEPMEPMKPMEQQVK